MEFVVTDTQVRAVKYNGIYQEVLDFPLLEYQKKDVFIIALW